MQTQGKIVDIHNREIFEGSIETQNGRIIKINRHKTDSQHFIMPGFVDSHIHIESSMLTPAEFAKVAARKGTVAIVADPHEIANVCGINGVEYMIESAKNAAIKIFFTAPSCVPATPFENSGAKLGVEDVAKLMARPEFVAMGEMMNYPGVINNDPEVKGKIEATLALGKPVDGHAPSHPLGQRSENIHFSRDLNRSRGNNSIRSTGKNSIRDEDPYSRRQFGKRSPRYAAAT